MKAHQREAGAFATVPELVEQVSDNRAARMVAEEITHNAQAREPRLRAWLKNSRRQKPRVSMGLPNRSEASAALDG